jgi:hypothetical protein
MGIRKDNFHHIGQKEYDENWFDGKKYGISEWHKNGQTKI